MTDDEIIKDLECLRHRRNCENCQLYEDNDCYDILHFSTCEVLNIIDFIKRQQEEIERLEAQKLSREKDRDYWMVQTRMAREKVETAKSEAIKEFADKLCDGRVSNDPVVIAVQAELKMTEEKE